MHTTFNQSCNVLCKSRAVVHICVHCWSNYNGSSSSHQGCAKHIIGNALSILANDISCCRSNQEQIGFFCKGNVLHLPMVGCSKHICNNGAVGQSFKCKWTDKFGCVLSHNDINVCTKLFKSTNNCAYLVNSNATCYTYNNVFSLQFLHNLSYSNVILQFL